MARKTAALQKKAAEMEAAKAQAAEMAAELARLRGGPPTDGALQAPQNPVVRDDVRQ